MREALRRHCVAIAAIVVASWGWALFWPQGLVDLGRSAGGSVQDASGVRLHLSYAYVVRGWGVHGALRKGTNAVSVERVKSGDFPTPVSPREARELIQQHYGDDALGRGGWFIDWQALALACSLGALLSVVSSTWWIAFRTPRAPTSPRWVVVGALGMAIWPALLGIAPAVWTWRALGSVEPRGVVVLHPEWMLVGTVYLVSVIAVALGRTRPATI